MGRRLKGRIRLLRDRGFEVALEVGDGPEELGIGKSLQGLAAETGHRLVESAGWMLDLSVAGSWIPSLLIEIRRHRQHRPVHGIRLIY